jgi:hypothetical protein
MADDPYCSRYCPGTCQACACPEIWAPVCGEDGNTYGNDCEARCAHVAVVSHGECGGPVECNADDQCAPDEICQVECAPWVGGGEDVPGGEGGSGDGEGEGTPGSEGGSEDEPLPGWASCIAPPPPECRGTCVARPICEPVLCDLYCEHGFAIDERGCETCSCNPPPPPPERYCFTNEECDGDAEEICDISECRSPCEGSDEICPPACWGVCRGPMPEPEPAPVPR